MTLFFPLSFRRSSRLFAAALAVLAASVALPAPTLAADAAPADPALEAAEAEAEVESLLARLDAARPDLTGRCLRAAFERRKTTPLLRRPLRSSGVLTASGGALRWETLAPRAGETVIAGGEMRIVYPDEKRVEVFELGAAASVGFGPASPLSALSERFAVSRADPPAWAEEDAASQLAPRTAPLTEPLPGLIGLRLVPRDPDVASQLRSIGLGVEEATGSVRLLETVDGDGSATTYRFGEAEVADAPCPIELPAPEGYEVVRPYGG